MEKKELLVVEREENMVAATVRSDPIKRMGWFINPTGGFPGAPPFVPSRHKAASFAAAEAPEILFKGWRSHLRMWEEWVHKLEPIYGESWKKAGIFEAIKASVYKIRRGIALVLGIAAYWCEETSSFLFPWGEATVTLEDVMVLGGYPVVGEPVRGSLDGELAEMKQRLTTEHKKFYRYTCKKPEQSAWVRHFSEGEGDELEHAAFLSLWLSRFVFPGHPEKTVRVQAIPIAVRLARGARIALAPAVLASLYRDLRAVKDFLVSRCNQEVQTLAVWAPFDLLHMWVWERFEALRPDVKKFVDYGEPRTKRWTDARRELEFSFIRWVFESPSQFQWRPYAFSLDNWRKPAFYKENGEWIHGCADEDGELRSFAQCLRASELVGVDCIEQYLPHRVAMQFGLDQDLPCYSPRSDSTWEAAWKTYEIDAKDAVFYVPPEIFRSDVTLQYSVWWQKCMLSHCIDAAKSVVGPHSSLATSKKDVKKRKAGRKNKKEKDCSLPAQKKQKLRESQGTPLLDSSAVKNHRSDGTDEHIKSQETSEQCNQTAEATRDINIENRTELGEAGRSDTLDMRYWELLEDVKIEDPEAFVPFLLKQRLELEQKRRVKESEEEMKLRKVNEEIAAMLGTASDPESQSEVCSKLKCSLFQFMSTQYLVSVR